MNWPAAENKELRQRLEEMANHLCNQGPAYTGCPSEKTKGACPLTGPVSELAEREGFEPSIRYYRIHTFQACSFNHSDTSPDTTFVALTLEAGQVIPASLCLQCRYWSPYFTTLSVGLVGGCGPGSSSSGSLSANIMPRPFSLP